MILLIEDLQKEIFKAKKIFYGLGIRKIVVATNLEDAERITIMLRPVGIVTDLYFPDNGDQNNPNNPNGISIIYLAEKNKIPVVVCSDIDHHHVPRYIWRIKEYHKVNFVMDKNWEEAINTLLKILPSNVIDNDTDLNERLLMIVADDNSIEIALSIKRYFKYGLDVNLNPIIVNHNEALNKFLELRPKYSIVCDYNQEIDVPGNQTFSDLFNSSLFEQIVVKYNYKKSIKDLENELLTRD